MTLPYIDLSERHGYRDDQGFERSNSRSRRSMGVVLATGSYSPVSGSRRGPARTAAIRQMTLVDEETIVG